MKYVLIVLVIIICILIGIKIKQYFIKRYLLYKDLALFCESIFNEISYNSEKMTCVIENNISVFKNDTNLLLNNYLKYLLNLITLNELKIKIKALLYYLNDAEKEEILNFFVNLGSFTKQEELTRLSSSLLKFRVLVEKSRGDKDKFSNMYLKLFFALGFTIAIVFI